MATRFTLVPAAYAAGYGEAVVPLARVKAHCRIDSDDDDDLVEALRDAAINMVEQYCEVRLLQTAGIVWRGESFAALSAVGSDFGVRPVIAVTGVTQRDADGNSVTVDPADYRAGYDGSLLPVDRWPVDAGGLVTVTLTAGYPSGACPPALVQAVMLFTAHLWMHREAVMSAGVSGEVPLGFRMLCAPFRRVRL